MSDPNSFWVIYEIATGNVTGFATTMPGVPPLLVDTATYAYLEVTEAELLPVQASNQARQAISAHFKVINGKLVGA